MQYARIVRDFRRQRNMAKRTSHKDPLETFDRCLITHIHTPPTWLSSVGVSIAKNSTVSIRVATDAASATPHPSDDAISLGMVAQTASTSFETLLELAVKMEIWTMNMISRLLKSAYILQGSSCFFQCDISQV